MINDNPQIDDALLTDLLSNAGARVAPPADFEAQMRVALHAQWQSEVKTHKQQRRHFFAIAAGLALVAISATIWFRGSVPTIISDTVARIERIDGNNIYWGVERSPELYALSADHVFKTGQRVTTGSQSRLALALSSNSSLRLDQNSSVHIVSDTHISLERGALYIDSVDGELASLIIDTKYGEISHLGTQFIVNLAHDNLSVAVREGQVRVSSEKSATNVDAGEQLQLDEHGAARTVSISRRGAQWQWVENIAPAPRWQRPKVDEFLMWVARETGHTLEYGNQQTHDLAKSTQINGFARLATTPRGPLQTLELVMPTTGLVYEISNGAIIVRAIDNP